MIKRMVLMLLVVGAVFAAIFGYRIFMGTMMRKMMAGKAPAEVVSAVQVQMASWQPRIKSVGSIRAVRGVNITTEAPGIIKEIFFNSGDEVKAGQVLIALNADTDAAQLRSLKVEAELARTIYERDRKQFAVGAVSQAALDGDIAELKSKQALASRQKAVAAQKMIRAPFAGRLGINMVNLGQYMNPGDKIVTLQALDSVYVDFFLPQQEVSRIALGQTVEMIVDSYPGRIFSGKITAIDPQVEKETRNIQIEALVENSKHELLAGMYASVEVLAGEAKNYLTLPQAAVAFNPYGETVFVVDDKGIVKQKFITTGETRGDQVAVAGGLNEGETVVTSGQVKLKNGSHVTINNDVLPANDERPHVDDE
jgi:membrane fusion protein, multidrug efflux system